MYVLKAKYTKSIFVTMKTYGTAQLQLHFYARGHAWYHTLFRVSNAKVSCGNLYFHETRHGIAMRRDVVFTRDVAFTCNGIMTFPCDMVVLTKLNNRQDSS